MASGRPFLLAHFFNFVSNLEMNVKAFVALLGVALVAGLAVYFAMGGINVNPQPQNGETKTLKTEKDFRDKIATYRREKQKVLNMVTRLEARKQETLDYLKSKGVRSSADVTDDKDIIYALKNLKAWKMEIEKLREQSGYYDEAITSMNAMLQDIERKRIGDSLAMSDEERMELDRIVIDLDERLDYDPNDPIENDDLRQILDEEMKNDRDDGGPPDPGE